MTNLNNIQSIFFIGIGGIGMSALARYFNHRKVQVSGFDRTATPLTKQLEAEGISVHYYDDVALLDKSAQLVVYTPAIPADHTQLNWYRGRGYEVVKRSDVLGMITEHSFNICVAGTHGKTSISTMVAHVLRHTGYGCNAFLGGVSVNYGTNFWASDTNVCVIEADEYDRSFLKLSPDIAVITSMDPDHLDIYHTAENMEMAFVEFAGKTKPSGVLIRKHALLKLNEAQVRRQITYAMRKEVHEGVQHADHGHHEDEEDVTDVFADNIEVHGNGYRFDAHISGAVLNSLQLNVGGLHNLENMLVAITVAKLLKIEDEAIASAVAAYRGVKRRFEYILDGSNTPVFIDDYAHHPGELKALLSSVKHLFPGRHITVVFQPHLFSRTNDFADGFAETLSIADSAVLLPIYPARELPVPGVTSELISSKMQHATLLQKQELENWLLQHKPDVLVTAGAGDIDAMVPMIKQLLQQKMNMN